MALRHLGVEKHAPCTHGDGIPESSKVDTRSLGGRCDAGSKGVLCKSHRNVTVTLRSQREKLKLSPFGSLLQYGTHCLGYPKRDHNFDNHPCGVLHGS